MVKCAQQQNKQTLKALEKTQERVDQFQLFANSLPQLVWMANETG